MTQLMMLVPKAAPLRVDLGGVIRVGHTRVTLETVIEAFKRGDSPAAIHDAYESLPLDDIYSVITYYLWNRAEVEDYLAEQSQKAAEARLDAEARNPPDAIRERLLQRRAGGA
jgi:uncharacterized protein (DUF433 family)